MRSPVRAASSVAAFAALALHATSVLAQTGADEATRTQMIDQAMEARRTGDHARAIELARRANELRMTGTLQGFIAREHLEMNNVADALGALELCVRDAPSEPASRSRDAILNYCREQLPQVRTRVGRVVVVPRERPPGLAVRVSGRALNNALLEVPYVVTPGNIVVEATAPGFAAFRQEVQVNAGGNVTVNVTMTPEAGGGGVASGATGGGTSSGAVGSSGASGEGATGAVGVTAPVRTRTVYSPVGPVIMGVGAVGLITAAITWVMAEGQFRDAMQMYPADPVARANSIETLDTITTIGLIGGAALVGVGAVLTFTLTRQERIPATATIVPTPRGAAFVLRF